MKKSIMFLIAALTLTILPISAFGETITTEGADYNYNPCSVEHRHQQNCGTTAYSEDGDQVRFQTEKFAGSDYSNIRYNGRGHCR